MKTLGMLFGVLMVLAAPGWAQDPVAQELEQLRARVEKLEADAAEQRARQEEINELLLRAMDSTTEKLDLFLEAVAGGLLPVPGTDEGAEPVREGDLRAVLWISGLAVGLVLLALVWNLRSVRRERVALESSRVGGVGASSLELSSKGMVEAPVQLPSEPPVGLQEAGAASGKSKGAPPAARVSKKRAVQPAAERVSELDIVGAIGSGTELESGGVEPLGDLSVENVGPGELGLGNVSPVELEDPVGEMPGLDQPQRVQWKLACGNPELGRKLAEDLLAMEPGVLKAPPPRVEKQGRSLRIAYHVHPGLLVADRTQIAARLMEVLRAVPVVETSGGESRG